MASESLTNTLRAAFAHARNLDGSLAERLADYSNAIAQFHPAYARAVDDLVTRLNANDAGAAAPRPGEPMPPFLLPDETGRLISLADVTADGPAAVMFHRGHWCPWCRISLEALSHAQQELTAARGKVVAVTPERQQFALAFKADARAPFPVLTDVDNGYALLLNLAIWIGPDLAHLLSDLGRVLPDYQGNDTWMLPIPAAFVVDRTGIVRYRFLDPDFRRRAAIDDLIGALRDAG
jgi:peroxiredoxin